MDPDAANCMIAAGLVNYDERNESLLITLRLGLLESVGAEAASPDQGIVTSRSLV
jgi:hypothetical protein